MTAYDDLVGRAQRSLMSNYATAPLVLVRGDGCTVWDSEGRDYLDLVAGIAVCSLGHAHPAIGDAVRAQLATLGHVSNLFLTEPAVALAERLLALSGRDGRVFFANSGAEAVEAALKLARKRGGPGKTRVIAADGAFHGRTIGALSLTGQPAKQAPFAPLPGDVTFVPYGDSAALTDAVGDDCAAVFLEPIQGEVGVVPAPPGYLAAARRVCDAHNAVLVLDEVQTGIGRTGTWFRWQAEDVTPDVMTLAKGLGGGLPIGATVAFGDAADVLAPGDHGSTFGGNPVVCAAALAVLDTLENDGLVEAAGAKGERLAKSLGDVPGVADVRGSGLLLGMVVADIGAKAVESAARQVGFLVNGIAPDVVRIAPPLIVSDAELERFAASVPGILAAARQ